MTNASRSAARALAASLFLALAGCGALPQASDESEPIYVPPQAAAEDEREELASLAGGDGGLATTVDESPAEPPPEALEPEALPPDTLANVLVKARPRGRYDEIRDLVAEAKALLDDVELRYVFTGKAPRETLRGRPVAFALWDESTKEWTVAHLEIPRPPVRWVPGRRPLQFRVLTPGITARHVKGVGAERLMFSFTRGDEPLKVYGRKFPVFDNALLNRGQWRAVAKTARPIVYLPFTEDAFDQSFVQSGREFLLTTARRANEELRAAAAPSRAFPGQLLADVVPPELITALAVIEQADDADYLRKRAGAFDEVLSQYGLKREEAYRYSVSSANALGAMQFTNRRGNGTYAMVVRLCPAARLDPVFERGATDIFNSMKAAICLFDIELSQMTPDLRRAYWDNKRVLGIFPVAAYNGGPRNVARLRRVIASMRLGLEDLRPPGVLPADGSVSCPCLWTDGVDGVRPVAIPRYNNENRWYVQKYQTLVSLFEAGSGEGGAAEELGR